MANMLYAFGLGIVFVVGVIIGSVLANLLAGKEIAKARQDLVNANNRVEERLDKYVRNTDVLAEAARIWIGQHKGDHPG